LPALIVKLDETKKTAGGRKAYLYELASHEESIQCPGCNSIQLATVQHTQPFATKIHHCTNCEYIIMESDWCKINPNEQTQTR